VVVGTPDSAIRQLREIFATIRPGNVFFSHGDGDMAHEDAMRHIGYMRDYVLPALRDISVEFGLPGAFEVDPVTGRQLQAENTDSAV
jgi:hypothetical protein